MLGGEWRNKMVGDEFQIVSKQTNGLMEQLWLVTRILNTGVLGQSLSSLATDIVDHRFSMQAG